MAIFSMLTILGVLSSVFMMMAGRRGSDPTGGRNGAAGSRGGGSQQGGGSGGSRGGGSQQGRGVGGLRGGRNQQGRGIGRSQGGGSQPSGSGQRGSGNQPDDGAEQGTGSQTSGRVELGSGSQPGNGAEQAGGSQPSSGSAQGSGVGASGAGDYQHGSCATGGRGQGGDGEDSSATHTDITVNITGGRGRGRRRNITVTGVPENDPRFYSQRGYSYGGFGTFPSEAIKIRIANNEIESAQALRNLLAIMRLHWPEDVIHQSDVDRVRPDWWDIIIDEFFNYYTFDPQYATEDEARASIIEHMRDNMRKILSEEKTRADKNIQKNGGDYVDHRPTYLKPRVWEKFCEYWKSDDFQRRSAFAKAARGRVRTPHTSGSYTFERRRRDYKRKHGVEQDIIEHFKDTHTLRKKKQSDQISQAAIDAIIKRYLEICVDKDIDPKKTQIHSWIDAVGSKKNKVLGFPKLLVSDVIGSKARASTRKGEGGSGRSSLTRMRDDLLMRVVDQTLAHALSHPEDYQLTPDQIRLLAQEFLDGESDLPADHPIAQETRQNIIQVMIDVLNHLYKAHGPGKAKGKAHVEDDGADHDHGDRDADDNDDGDGGSRLMSDGTLRIMG